MILVVDDEPAIAEVVGSVLEDEGYEVATAADGEAALELLHAGPPPCLAIVDLMMPRMNGWQLRGAMLAEPELAEIPVVILSAHAGGGGDVAELRPAAVIEKPFQLDRILEVVARHCR